MKTELHFQKDITYQITSINMATPLIFSFADYGTRNCLHDYESPFYLIHVTQKH